MKKLLLFAVIGLLASSCVKNNPDPSWLEVTEWTLEANGLNNVEGELTHNFTDAWVYVDNKLIGVFEVPFKIPLLLSGNSEIKLYPTVHNNGISATKKIYPFVEPYIIDAELVKNQTLTINPVTKYYTQTQFQIWDFEDGGNIGFEETPQSLAHISQSNDPAIKQWFNGNQFGRIDLDGTNYYWQASTNINMTLPQNGAEVYLEVDYHNTSNIVTGVIAFESSNVVSNINVQMNAQDPSTVEWKKIYIDMKTIVSGSVNANYFRNSFEAILPDTLSTGQINIDNIKVVHF